MSDEQLVDVAAGRGLARQGSSGSDGGSSTAGGGSPVAAAGLGSAVGGGRGDFGRAVIRQLVEHGHDPVAVIGGALRDSVASTASGATSATADTTEDEQSKGDSDDSDESDGDASDDSDALELSNGGENLPLRQSHGKLTKLFQKINRGVTVAGGDSTDDGDDASDTGSSTASGEDDSDDSDDDSESDEEDSSLELSLDGSTIAVKWVYADQVRKAILRSDVSFSKLRRRVRREYERGLRMAYLDDEEGGAACVTRREC